MKMIGLLGGMSWESSLHYYRLANERVRQRQGGLTSARCILYSLDFAPIASMQAEGRWQEAGAVLAGAAQCLEQAGAEVMVLCTNTMHVVAEQVESAISIPLLHIADVTAQEISRSGLRRVGLLGTRFTMEQSFYAGRMAERHGIEVLTPDRPQRELIHQVIYDELCRGIVNPSSRAAYIEVVQQLAERGAAGIIFGCTEIMLLLRSTDVALPVFDSTSLHATAAVDFALAAASS